MAKGMYRSYNHTNFSEICTGVIEENKHCQVQTPGVSIVSYFPEDSMKIK